MTEALVQAKDVEILEQLSINSEQLARRLRDVRDAGGPPSSEILRAALCAWAREVRAEADLGARRLERIAADLNATQH
jgi:hypothetical protein